MKMSNEELVCVYEEAQDSIKTAISTLERIDEYKEVLETLKIARDELEEESESYIQAYRKECDEELEYQNREYERSVL